MSPLLIAAGESSKVPFYIVGGVLALYAVILATIGIRRPDFPGSARGQRGVIVLSLVLMIAALAAAILTD